MRFLPLAFLLAVGCGGPQLAAVTGKVTRGGQGVTAGSIYLHPADGGWKGEPPSSVLQTDGSFTIKTYPHGDGVPPGKYKATLTPGLAQRIGKPDLADPQKTPWTLEVPAAGVSGHVFTAD